MPDCETCTAAPSARETNLLKWNCHIPGKENTLWEGGFYPLTMEFSEEYPARPPKVCVGKCILGGIHDLQAPLKLQPPQTPICPLLNATRSANSPPGSFTPIFILAGPSACPS